MRMSDWSSDVCSSDLKIVHHVQARDVLLVEVVDRVRILLAEDRHQHVGASDLLLARGLHVVDRTLQHALEAERRLGVAAIVLGQARHRAGDRLFQVASQSVEVGAGRLQDGLRRRVVEQREQQVFRSEEHTSELQSLMRISYAVFCLKKKTKKQK